MMCLDLIKQTEQSPLWFFQNCIALAVCTISLPLSALFPILNVILFCFSGLNSQLCFCCPYCLASTGYSLVKPSFSSLSCIITIDLSLLYNYAKNISASVLHCSINISFIQHTSLPCKHPPTADCRLLDDLALYKNKSMKPRMILVKYF